MLLVKSSQAIQSQGAEGGGGGRGGGGPKPIICSQGRYLTVIFWKPDFLQMRVLHNFVQLFQIMAIFASH